MHFQRRNQGHSSRTNTEWWVMDRAGCIYRRLMVDILRQKSDHCQWQVQLPYAECFSMTDLQHYSQPRAWLVYLTSSACFASATSYTGMLSTVMSSLRFCTVCVHSVLRLLLSSSPKLNFKSPKRAAVILASDHQDLFHLYPIHLAIYSLPFEIHSLIMRCREQSQMIYGAQLSC